MEVRFVDRKRAQTPDGGWGYVVVLASSIMMIVTSGPVAGFGIIFGNVLEDPTSGITLITSTYNTISFFMGIVANVLLRRSSYRQVALLGSLINFIGGLATVFSPNIHLLILSYGVLQGVGYGLLLPASFSALNAYFDKKMALMMSINQTLLVAGYMVVPYWSNWCMNFYGYQGTLLLLAGMAAFCFPASMALQPVKWHMTYVEDTMDFLPRRHSYSSARRRRSSAFLGERAVSLVSLKLGEHRRDDTGFWQAMLDSLDLDLLGDWKYVNIAVGLSLSFTADIAFFPILPSVMAPQGFTAAQIALMISVFFTADLVARVAFSLLAAFVPINSRLVVLLACASSALLRLALPIHQGLNYKLTVLGAMGFVRCFIQTPQALVISDNYPDNFESAYSIYMVVNGVVTLFYGGLMSYIKTTTGSDEWVCHSLTLGFVMVVVTWGAELITSRSKR